MGRGIAILSLLDASELEELKSWSQILAVLEQSGWVVIDSLRRVSGTAAWQGTGNEQFERLRALAKAATDVEISLSTGFRARLVNEQLECVASPSAVNDYYTGNELELAQRAADGDVEALLQLEGQWRGAITLDLAKALSVGPNEWTWRVVRSYDRLKSIVDAMRWWEIRTALGGDQPVYIVLLDEVPRWFQSASWCCGSLSRLRDPTFDPTNDERASYVTARGGDPGVGVPLPDQLLPVAPHENVGELVDVLRAKAAAACWAWFSNDVAIEEDSSRLAFFGLRRIDALLPPAGVEQVASQLQVIDLFRWTQREPSFDKILAIRQVVSIYSTADFLDLAYDVRRAAEPIYAGLRSDAVAEASSMVQTARQLSVDAARQTLVDLISLSKGLGERVLATLGGLGAIVLASATSNKVPPEISGDLAFAIGSFLIFLALWTLIVEGPTVYLPLKFLKDDVRSAAPSLGSEQMNQILQSPSVRKAQGRVRLIRVLAPAVYAVAAGVAFWVAYPYPTAVWMFLHLRH
ncbi:MAG: hypothetical protein M3290_01525 [Actinomycetota bacterium]|nr:hypothetical protein [Actinomycetota bacterium]